MTGALLLGTAAAALALPDAPTLTDGPGVGSNSTYTRDNTPTFDWTGGAGGLGTYVWSFGGLTGAGSATSATPSAALADGPHTFTVQEEGDGGSSEDPLSPPASAGFTVDTVDPVAASSANIAPNANGWYGASVASVTVTHSCDPGTGAPLTVTPTWPQTDVVTAVGTTVATPSPANACRDQAGNSVPNTSFTVRIDRTAPSFTLSVGGGATPGLAGWFVSGNPTANYTCETASSSASGVANCPTDETVISDGISTFQGGTVTDRAGNVSASVPNLVIKRDIRDPDKPLLEGPSSITNQTRPAFEWSKVDDARPAGVEPSGVTRYRVEIRRNNSSGAVVHQNANVPQTPGTGGGSITYTLPAGLDLDDGTTYWWTATAFDEAGNSNESAPTTFRVDTTAPNPPTITEGPQDSAATNDATPTFTFSGLAGASFQWETRNNLGEALSGAGFSGSGPGTMVTLPALPDGSFSFRVRQTNPVNGVPSGWQTATFTVDTTAPQAPTITSGPGTGGNPQPAFAWRPAEQGGGFVWEVLGVGGVRVQGPGDTSNTTVQLPSPLAPNSYVFRVRQRDRAGNLGDWSVPEPFTIIAAPNSPPVSPTPPTTPTQVQRFRPSTRNAKALTPRVGALLRPTRAVLRWKRFKGATLYNVQIFRIDGTRYTKIHSAFPRGRSYRVPRRVLKANKRYVWRVWPYLGRKRTYSRNPLGISWFDTRPTAPRTR